MELENKTALITGGARMGEKIASDLARSGCDIVLVYQKSKKSAEQTARLVRSFGQKAFLFRVDLTSPSSIQRLLVQIKKSVKRLDILIHLASIYEAITLKRLKSKDWEKSMAVHVTAAYQLCMGLRPLMTSQEGGRIVLASDWIAASGRPRYQNYLHYYTAKKAVLGLTEGLALELAPHSVLVNAVAPGPIVPPAGISPSEARKIIWETPLKKWGGVDEISKAVLYLIQTDFVTGECIRVDGGRHLY